MKLRELIARVAEDWPEYRKLGTIDGAHSTNLLVVKEFSQELKRLSPQNRPFLHTGSSGKGNIAVAPWVATFHPQITKAATDGYYPVYLFSADLERVYLSFALGATQFQKQFGSNKNCLQKIETAAQKIQGHCQDKHPPKGLDLPQLNLNSIRAPWSYEAYEVGSIFSFAAYQVDNLPPNSQLEADYQGILDFYLEVVEDPAIPDIDELVEASLPKVEASVVESYLNFQPRSPKKARNTGGKGGGQRRSKVSKKVGNAGELTVLRAEKKKLIQAGLTELAAKIDHHAARGDTPGWDITSYDLSGAKIYIEVKATKGKQINGIEITRNEWKAANDPKIAEQYWIYLVKEALSQSPKIEVFKHPAKRVATGELCIETSVYELSLHSKA